MLDEILARLAELPDDKREEVKQEAVEATGDLKWIPNPGPQTEAYFCKADILLYGGSGGGGKSDLGLGLAFNCHQRALVMRRKYVELSALVDRAVDINGTKRGLNASPPPKLTTDDGRVIEFGAAQRVGDEQSWQGRARDLLYVDEAAQFAESQVRFLMGWVRPPNEKATRCRVVLGSNPPLSEEGEWMVRMFAPWLDPQHTDYPAKPGQLRWYVTDAGEDFEVPGPGDYLLSEDGQLSRAPDDARPDDTLTALSRTFMPARLGDNPFLMRDKQYKAQQDALPPHLRAAIRDGNFTAARRDHELQMIPSEWIRLAQARWTDQAPAGVPMTAIGVDIAQGGEDDTVLSPRHDWWFAPLVTVPGVKTPYGSDIAGLVLKHRRDHATVVLDMGGGYGGGAYEQLAQNVERERLVKYKGASASKGKAKHSGLGFKNTRAEAYWRLYEALDPGQPGGAQIALPRSQMLFADLCSIRWHHEPDDHHTIQLESKKDLVARIGRSPNEGDAVVMSWYKGLKGANIQGGWKNHGPNKRPQVVLGRGANAHSRRGR